MRRGVGRCYLPVFLESRNCRTTKEGAACFAVADAGKMMFGPVNRIARDEPGLTPAAAGNIPADQIAALELYHRSRNNRDAIGAQLYLAEFLRLYEPLPCARPVHRVEAQRTGAPGRGLRAAAQSRLGGPALHSGRAGVQGARANAERHVARMCPPGAFSHTPVGSFWDQRLNGLGPVVG